ncbi:cysteine hydrolase family protein [Amycolatopsis magusensis]|uniref:cysteine hydrolase family protein n=1 Tax=Amycolatopsis magusensis TaxID=882444 RepID=UPI0024A9BFB4|nr:isochorismatase family cysteine hydrolase [Amycolatopsis magusensis]MDI5976105.1 isochorismatase family cysteine hydrolase [Amycolatopsis magusensis]
MRPGTVLVVVDLQNDFCAGQVVAGRYGGDLATLRTVAANAARAVDTARAHGTEVVFVRFLGDVEYQPPSWRRRDAARDKPPKCLEGTWGAEFHAVSPAPGEHVFTKKACFDAFLGAGFEQHLARRGAEHLVFAGLYADVCVDSTARTAFQKGYHITVLADCTTGLHLRDEEILRFMRVLYGARTTTHDRPETWVRLGEMEETWSAQSPRTAVSTEASA